MTGSAPALWPLIRGRVSNAGTTAARTQERYYAGSNTGWIRTHGDNDDLEGLELGDMKGQLVQTTISKTSLPTDVDSEDELTLDNHMDASGQMGGIRKTVDISFMVSKVA